MAVATTTLTGTIYDSKGAPAAGAVVYLDLDVPDWEAGGVLPDMAVSITANASGVISSPIWPNAAGTRGSRYKTKVKIAGRTYELGKIFVPLGSTVTLQSLLDLPPQVPLSETLLAQVVAVRAQTQQLKTDVQAIIASAGASTYGQFGLGGNAVLVTALNDITASGFYRTAQQTILVDAPALGNWDVIHTNYDSTRGTQIAICSAFANVGQVWKRYQTGATTWSAWRRVYDQLAILGTVSLSGSIPTGAIFEGGSNANGTYERNALGRQQCERLLTIPAGGSATWTFPATFIDANARIQVTPLGSAARQVSVDGVSATAATIYLKDSAGAAVAGSVYVSARGNW